MQRMTFGLGVSVLTASTLVLPGCHNKQMVGAATKVTSGRVFKTAGAFGTIEQQMLFDLQGISIEPGEFMRNGGFGEPGTMFTLQYTGDDSIHRTTQYDYAYSQTTLPVNSTTNPPGQPAVLPPLDAGQFVATVGSLMQRVDRQAANLARAEFALASVQPAKSSTEITKELGELVEKLKLDSEESDLLTKIMDSLGISEKPSSAASASASSTGGEQPPSGGSTSASAAAGNGGAGGGKTNSGESENGAPDKAAAARQAVADAQAALDATLDHLDRLLASGRNYLIFQWSAKREGSANASAGDKVGVKATQRRSDSGFAVAAGIRRCRLLLGRDLTEAYLTVDPYNELVKWHQDSWSGSGLVTETMEVNTLQYFTRGEFEETVELLLSASPKDLAGVMTPEALMNLKVTLALTARKLATYENRASLGPPRIADTAVDWTEVLSGQRAMHDGWTTLVSVATTFKFLEDVGRLDRKRVAHQREAGPDEDPTATASR